MNWKEGKQCLLIRIIIQAEVGLDYLTSCYSDRENQDHFILISQFRWEKIYSIFFLFKNIPYFFSLKREKPDVNLRRPVRRRLLRPKRQKPVI